MYVSGSGWARGARAGCWSSHGRRNAGSGKVRPDEVVLLGDVVRLASRFGRYGYRQVTNLLRIEGWSVNHKRVERI